MIFVGKTFTGDYLDVVHGFSHVDGDVALRNLNNPKYKKLFEKLTENKCRYPNEDGDPKLYGPFYQEMVDRALEAAKKSDKVIITIAVQRQTYRDFVMDKLREGGAKDPTMLFLSIDKNVLIDGYYDRTKRQWEAAGSTIEDFAKGMLGWEGEGEVTLSVWRNDIYPKLMKTTGFDDFDPAPSYATVVDVSTRDVAQLDRIDAALGLVRTAEAGTYEEIVEKVLAIDHKRDEENPYCGEEWQAIAKEAEEKMKKENKSTEEIAQELKQIKQRGSSLAKLERSMSVFNSTRSSGPALSKSSRRSFIMTGKIDLE